MVKGYITNWDSVTSYVAAFFSGQSEDYADVNLEVGEEAGLWYVQTRDDAGGEDEGPDEPFASRDKAEAWCRRYAAEKNVAGKGESADEYRARMREEEEMDAVEDG